MASGTYIYSTACSTAGLHRLDSLHFSTLYSTHIRRRWSAAEACRGAAEAADGEPGGLKRALLKSRWAPRRARAVALNVRQLLEMIRAIRERLDPYAAHYGIVLYGLLYQLLCDVEGPSVIIRQV